MNLSNMMVKSLIDIEKSMEIVNILKLSKTSEKKLNLKQIDSARRQLEA